MPIYVAMDSAEVWETPELFLFDADGKPTEVAGVPPDAFSADGQLWGNPLYDWAYHKRTNFKWWKRRLEQNLKMFDVVRIDHFRAFESYFAYRQTRTRPNAANGARDRCLRRLKTSKRTAE